MAGYENDKLINIEAFHIKSGNRVQDAQIRLHLLSSQLLNTRLFIRPQLLSEVQNMYAPSHSYSQSSQGVVAASVAAFSDDLMYKSQYAKRSFRPIIEAFSEVKAMIGEQIVVVKNIANRAYYEDKFYMKTICETSEDLITAIKYVVQQ